MRWLLRSLLLGAVAVIALGLFARGFLVEAKHWVLGSSQVIATTTSTNQARVEQAATTHTRRTGLVRALDELLQSLPAATREELEQHLGGGSLSEQLRTADAALARIKAETQVALREANRQVRVAGRSPNVVLVVVEGLDRADLGVYGQQRIQTPNLDRLAAEGLAHPTFYASALGSEADWWSLTTGLPWSLYPARHEIRACSVAQTLWKGGYWTAAVGDLSPEALADPPRRGFQEWVGVTTPEAAQQPYPRTMQVNGSVREVVANRGDRQGRWADQLWVERGVDLLDKAPRNRPVFLTVSLSIPRDVAQWAQDARYRDRPWAEQQKAYAAAISRLDDQIGLLEGELELRRLKGSTLVAVIGLPSDRGDSQVADFFRPEDGLRQGDKGLAEGDLRRPLLVRWPAGLRGELNVETPAALYDIAPTLYAATGTQRKPRALPGVNLVRFWKGQAEPIARTFHWGHPSDEAVAIRQGAFKGILVDQRLSVYNLASDARETQDVAPSEPDASERIRQQLSSASL